MIGKRDVALGALQSVSSLHPDFHDKILAALDCVGLLDKPNLASVHGVGGGMSVAAAQSRQAAVKLAAGELRRAGLDLKTDGPMSVHEINKALAERNVSPEQRIRIKSVLHAAGVLLD
jgi:hypothetical protein